MTNARPICYEQNPLQNQAVNHIGLIALYLIYLNGVAAFITRPYTHLSNLKIVYI